MKWGYQINPNKAARNGKFFGFEGRTDEVQLVVIHTGEVEPDLDGTDTAAQRLSAFMGNERHSRVSWHATVDSQSVLQELPTEWTGAHVKNWNSRTVGIEIGTRHNMWAHVPSSYRSAVIENLARVAAWMCQRHNLPGRHVTSLDEARAGATGLVAHATLDPARRSDPGPDFPWADLIDQVQRFLEDGQTMLGIGDRGRAVLLAQRELDELGYGHLVGVADGIAGPLFDDAVRAYEQDMGLPETGLWNGPLSSKERRGTGGLITISGSVGNGGTNRREDVEAIKRRLNELGFLIGDRSLEHSIRLFQAAKDGSQRIGGKDGRVDPGGDTLAWLNALNAPRWVHMPAGSDAEGFRSKERTQIHDDHGWGTSWLAEALVNAAAKYKSSYLDRRQNGPLIWSNDASPKRGGDTRDHGGHEAGMQLDIVLPPGSANSRTIRVGDGRYDRDAARHILRAFRATSSIEMIFLNDSTLRAEGLCSFAAGHDNHMHIHIKPPARIDRKPGGGGNGGRVRIDWEFIRQQEGFRTDGYVPQENGKAIGQSGVTIGSGFDLGQHSAEYLANLGAPAHLVDLLRPYFGLKRDAAINYLRAHPLRMQRSDVLIIDELVKGQKAGSIEKQYDRDSSSPFRRIPPAAQTVIVSVLFQYGRTARVPKFWGFATRGEWKNVIAELRDFGDRYGSRRRREADYLQQGLASGRSAKELTPSAPSTWPDSVLHTLPGDNDVPDGSAEPVLAVDGLTDHTTIDHTTIDHTNGQESELVC